jgi:uncharacterized membrane protein YgcG
MAIRQLLTGLLVGFKLLRRLVAVVVVTVVGVVLVREMVRSGQLPPAPVDPAAVGLPPTVFGIPTAYAAGIALVDLFVLFGESGGGGAGGGIAGDGHGGGFGGGDGGGGGGGGDGGE